MPLRLTRSRNSRLVTGRYVGQRHREKLPVKRPEIDRTGHQTPCDDWHPESTKCPAQVLGGECHGTRGRRGEISRGDWRRQQHLLRRWCEMLHLPHFRSPDVALHHHVELETAHLNHLVTSPFRKISHFALGPLKNLKPMMFPALGDIHLHGPVGGCPWTPL